MSRNLVVVEDDEDIGRNVQELLESEGYAVVLFSNGKAALDYLKAGPSAHPSLILLDLMMPIMDGVQFRELQRLDPQLASIPVVIMTADGSVEAKRARLGALAFVKKPLDINEFLETVERFSSSPGVLHAGDHDTFVIWPGSSP